MTTPKIHTQFDHETNARLDQLFADWTLADNRAAEYEYGDVAILFFDQYGQRHTMSSQYLVTEADTAWGYYAKAVREAVHTQTDDQAVALPDLDLIAPRIKTADAPEFANYRICDVLPELEKQAASWKHRHPTGYKLALQAVETHKQALAEREAKINALIAKKPRLGVIVAERETGDDGQWANWDESSPMLGIDW